MSAILKYLRSVRGERRISVIAEAIGQSAADVRREGIRLMNERSHGVIFLEPRDDSEPSFCAVYCKEWGACDDRRAWT